MPPCQLTMGFAVMFKVPNTFFLNLLIHTLAYPFLYNMIRLQCTVQSFAFFVLFFTLLNLYYFSLMMCVSVNTRMKEESNQVMMTSQ